MFNNTGSTESGIMVILFKKSMKHCADSSMAYGKLNHDVLASKCEERT